MERKIRSLNEEEYEKLLDAMRKQEGWREGREEYIEVKKILGIHINKKRTITEFLVGDTNSSTWISKHQAIALAEAGRLHAIVVNGKNRKYLRPQHHSAAFRNMLCSIEKEELSIV